MKVSSLPSAYALLASFAVLFALLVGVSMLGFTRTEQATRDLQQIVYEQDVKTGFVSSLFSVTRERSQLIAQLLSERNPTARTRATTRFDVLGRELKELSRKLGAVPLTAEERLALQRVIAASEEAASVHAQILGHAINGDIATARELTEARDDAAQDALQQALYDMLEQSGAATARVVQQSRQATRRALILVALVGTIVLLGAGMLAVMFTRQVRRTEGELQDEKELAQVTLHSIGDGVITADAEGRVEYLNPVAEQYTGWTTGQARGRPLKEIYRIIDERTGKGLDPLAHVPMPLPGEEASVVSVRLVDRNGRECPIRYSHAPIRSHEGKSLGMIVVFHDISQIRAMAQQLLWQASHDALTGLVNRREFERRLAELIDTARTQGREHALLFMDLDNFKTVNDTGGHTAGDELLRQLTALMLTRMRGSDTLARLGGDEFGALLESCPFDQALRIANALRETVREFQFDWEGRTYSVGVSIGLVPINAESGNLNRVLSLADACCYEAKNKGRDRVQVYNPDESDQTDKGKDLQVVSQISQAFELGRFRLYRQAIVPLASPGRSPNYEVLARMVDKAGNVVAPGAFMVAAGRYNLLTSIERWVIGSLIEHLHTQWTSGAIAREPSERGYYAVNLSGASINDKSVPEFLRGLLRRYPLPPGLLCFEITETTAISNLTAAAELIREFKALGCRFALDDFGTGMSSFAYLKNLPVDVLKIAGVFVRDMANDAMDAAIVEAINRIAHVLGMQTVAEELHDAETLAKAKALKIDYGQGYFIAPPEEIRQSPGGQPVELKSA